MFNLAGIRDVVYTQNELEKIDKYVNEQLASGLNADKLFHGLIAYIGEYMIHNLSSGKWEMIKPTGADIWEPYVVDKSGNRYNPFYVVYKELYEYFPDEGEVSLSEHTQVELVQHRIKIK